MDAVCFAPKLSFSGPSRNHALLPGRFLRQLKCLHGEDFLHFWLRYLWANADPYSSLVPPSDVDLTAYHAQVDHITIDLRFTQGQAKKAFLEPVAKAFCKATGVDRDRLAGVAWRPHDLIATGLSQGGYCSLKVPGPRFGAS